MQWQTSMSTFSLLTCLGVDLDECQDALACLDVIIFFHLSRSRTSSSSSRCTTRRRRQLVNTRVNTSQFLTGVMQRLAFDIGNECGGFRVGTGGRTARGGLAQLDQLARLVGMSRGAVGGGAPLALFDEEDQVADGAVLGGGRGGRGGGSAGGRGRLSLRLMRLWKGLPIL